MTRTTTKKTNRFLAFIMVAVLLANCLPLTVFGATEELLPFDSQATENTTGEADAVGECLGGACVTADSANNDNSWCSACRQQIISNLYG